MPNVRKEYVNKSSATSPIRSRWWLEKDEDIHRHVFGVVNKIDENQPHRRLMNLKFARLYHDIELAGLTAGLDTRFSLDSFLQNRVTYNVIKSAIDTIASKIAKNRPRPLFLTEEGNQTKQSRAKKLTRYMDGKFDTMDAYEAGQQAFLDSCIFGTGAMKVFREENEVAVERILIDEIIVDSAEGFYKDPRQIHQKKLIHREILKDTFPKSKLDIEQATGGSTDRANAQTSADQIWVVESWHLPSGKKAKDGRRAISIGNKTLLAEEYKKSYFPFVFLRWTNRVTGFYGYGLAEELMGIQLEINKILRSIQKALHLVAVPRAWVENGSRVNTSHINNETGAIVKYSGRTPVFETPTGMNPEVYNHLESLYQKAFEIAGVSQLSATSQKPAGLNAAVALREFQDIESERFQLTGQRYETFYMDAAKIVVDLTRDIQEDLKDSDESIKVKVSGSKFMETIEWKDVDLEDDQFVMRVFPSSILPTTPAGRLQTVQELIEAGFIGKDEGLSLLDMPDLQGFISIRLAAIDDIKKVIEDMLEKGEYQSPEPFMDLQTAIKMVQSAYLKAKREKVSENKLALMRTFIEDAQTLLSAGAPPPTAPGLVPQVGGQAPIAVPQEPPVSELLPITGQR